MRTNRAIVAGIVGGLAMTILAWLGRASGVNLNAEMILGTILGSAPSAAAWFVGLGLHLLLSALIALLYAAGFERVVHRAGAVPGLSFSLIHIVVAGLFMAILPALHAGIPEQMPAPGAFLLNMDAPVVALFLVVHLVYGAIVGLVYAEVENPASVPLNAL